MTNEGILHLRATVEILTERAKDADDAIAAGDDDTLVHVGRSLAYLDCRDMLLRILKAIDK